MGCDTGSMQTRGAESELQLLFGLEFSFSLVMSLVMLMGRVTRESRDYKK